MASNETTRCPVCMETIYEALPDTTTCGKWQCREALNPSPVSTEVPLKCSGCGVETRQKFPQGFRLKHYCGGTWQAVPPAVGDPTMAITDKQEPPAPEEFYDRHAFSYWRAHPDPEVWPMFQAQMREYVRASLLAPEDPTRGQ